MQNDEPTIDGVALAILQSFAGSRDYIRSLTEDAEHIHSDLRDSVTEESFVLAEVFMRESRARKDRAEQKERDQRHARELGKIEEAVQRKKWLSLSHEELLAKVTLDAGGTIQEACMWIGCDAHKLKGSAYCPQHYLKASGLLPAPNEKEPNQTPEPTAPSGRGSS